MSKKWRTVLIISLICNLAIIYVAVKALEYRAHINEYLDKYTNVVNEFSRLDRYADVNSALRSDTTITGRLVLFGSQIMENWPENNYPDGFEVINRGVTAQRVSGLLLRFRQDVIDLSPEAVVIEISSYNFRPESGVREICEYLASMADLARYNGIEAVPATIIPPLRDSVLIDDYNIMDSIGVFNDWLQQYCDENGLRCVDFNGAVSDTGGYLDEKYAAAAIDLNERGYARISGNLSELLAN